MLKEFKILLILIFLTISLSSCSSENSIFKLIFRKDSAEKLDTVDTIQDDYEVNISTFEKIIPIEFEKKTSEHDYTLSYYVYFGEKNCPDCEEFVYKLSKQAKEKDIKIHYINTDDSDSDVLEAIRKDYEIDTIPQLLKIYNLEKDFRLINTDSDIIAF